MWIKKTSQEISEENAARKQRSLTDIVPTIFISSFITLVGISLYSCDVDPYIAHYELIRSSAEIWDNRYWFALLFVVAFGIVHLITIFSKESSTQPDDGFRLCTKCDQFYPDRPKTCPECQDVLVDPRYYKWIDKKSLANNRLNPTEGS